MRCAAVSWRDPDGVHRPTDGIHLLWDGFDLIELSRDTYWVERRQRRAPFFDCDALDAAALAELRNRRRVTHRFGDVLYRTAPPFRPIALDGAPPPQATPVTISPQPPIRLAPFGTATNIEVFTQELTAPVEQIQVSGTARMVFVLAFTGDESVDVKWASTATFSVTLQGWPIDRVAVYAVDCTQLSFCPAVADTAFKWEPIATNLGLPVILDPVTEQWATERSVARGRLLPGESIGDDAFNHLAELLQLALTTPEQGSPRPGSRIVLMRKTTAEPFDEVTFTDAIAMLRLWPAMRRALGFAFSDLEDQPHLGETLTVGNTYEYRVTGVFNAADVADAIYDVHAVPSETLLPAAFRIRDLFLRFAEPPRVVLDPPPPATALTAMSRRGVAIESPSAGDWLFPSTGAASVVIDFPSPVPAVRLEVGAGHQFSQVILPLGNVVPLPPGTTIPLTFTAPVTRIALHGTGTLFAVRVPSGQHGLLQKSVQTGAITYGPTRLDSPLDFRIANLQTPPAIVQGPIDESTKVPPRHELGFRLEWLAPPLEHIDYWPADLGGDPPTAAHAYQITHERTDRPSPWEALEEDDNLIFATNVTPAAPPALTWGADIDAVFSASHPRPPDGPFGERFTDVFPTDAPPRAPAVPGTFHQYRIKAMDPFGRTSDFWTPSNIATLEKHVPPPAPVGPNLPVFDTNGQRIAPSGMVARVIAAGPQLSAADQAILAGHQNAIEINWGWGANERRVDPLASEFRVYVLAKPPDFVPGTIAGVAQNRGAWTLTFSTDRVLRQDECAGQWITSGDHPFLIIGHTAGSNVTIDVEASLLANGPAPIAGPASFGRPLAPELLRPAAWDARVAVIPLGAGDTYQHVLFDLLHPTDLQPVDAVWIGVSAADAESYVPDEIPPSAMNGNRPGNESGVTTATASIRYAGRPASAVNDPIGDVPELRTEEPTGRQVIVFLDFPAILDVTAPGALQPGEPVVVDRCSVDTLLTITSVAGGDVVMRQENGTLQPIPITDPADKQHVIDVLGGNRRTTLETRYLLHLATHFVNRDEIFKRVNSRIETFGVVEDLLAPKPQRCFYRVRRADRAGHVAADGTILPLIVRVPSPAPAKSPEKVRATVHPPVGTLSGGRPHAVGTGAPPGTLELEFRSVPDPEISHLLIFSELTPLPNKPLPGDGALLRVPNRPDLYPNGIRLRSPNGALLSPIVESLADADAPVAADGWRHVVVRLPATTPGWLRYWCAAITADGVPSPPIGPFTAGVGGP